jgi:NADP-dependent 3-hydroxy acid dehydrogenase YdfG
MRARRLSLAAGGVELLAEIQLEKITATLDARKPRVAVVDSIQTLWSEMLQSAPGSVAQVRECAAQLARHAKRSGTALFIIGHVTKEGAIAGPRVLEHIVDTVLYFEGDPHSAFRLVRAVKNRFGAVNELGVFAMTDKGLRAVTNPSAFFLSRHGADVAGSCVLATLEGTRPLLVEIQALVDSAHAPNPRRLTVGLEQNRLAMLLAVLHRHAGIATMDQDVFVNAVGGVRIAEPAADLAVSLAVVSSLGNRPIPGKLVVFGEIGLAGEVRPAPRGQDRLKEAAKLGFERAIIPKGKPAERKNRRAGGDRDRARRSGGRGVEESLARSVMKIVAVTGGAQGIGRAVAFRFAAAGYGVSIADPDEKAGLEAVARIEETGAKGLYVRVDVAQAEPVERWIAQTLEQLGCPDVLVNNAGIGRRAPFLELSTTDFDRVIAVNLRGTFLCSQVVARKMVARGQGGAIVNIASTRAFMSEPGTEAYTASKGGIVALTHAMAMSPGAAPDPRELREPRAGSRPRDWQYTPRAQRPVHSERDRLQHPVGASASPKTSRTRVSFSPSRRAS